MSNTCAVASKVYF